MEEVENSPDPGSGAYVGSSPTSPATSPSRDGKEVMFMKLSEALALRADTQKRVMQLRERLRASALVQEGEAPPEDPQELLAELDRLLGQLRDLVGRINRSNLAARLPNGMSLTDALAARHAGPARRHLRGTGRGRDQPGQP